MNENEKQTSHNLTRAQQEEIRYKQAHGQKISEVKANRAGKLTDKEYKAEYSKHKIPEHETHLFHVAVESRSYDSQSGRRISASRVVKYYPRVWQGIVDREELAGMTCEVLHDPTDVKVKKEPAKEPEKGLQGKGLPEKDADSPLMDLL